MFAYISLKASAFCSGNAMPQKRKAGFAAEAKDPETPPCDPEECFRRSVDARFKRRCVNGNKSQTFGEFQNDNPEALESQWKSAPHFATLDTFCKHWNLKQVHNRNESPDGSPAVFGLWLPCCLCLVDKHHLSGKLKDSRLAPQGWVSDIWTSAWQIGPEHKRMVVLNLCTELSSEDPLGRLGYTDMVKVLEEFLHIIDGGLVNNECLKTNLLMKFLSVDVSTASMDRVVHPLIEN